MILWDKLYGLMRLVFNYGEQTRKSEERIAALEEQNNELLAGYRHLAYEIQRLRDAAKHFEKNERNEREKAALRLEIDMLRFERRLPAPKQDEPDGG